MTAKERVVEAASRLRDIRAISYFIALLMVAFLGLLGWLIWILSDNWCAALAGVSKYAEEVAAANVTSECATTQRDQIVALKWVAYGLTGTLGLSILVFAVVVWSNAKLSFEGGVDGVRGDVSGA